MPCRKVSFVLSLVLLGVPRGGEAWRPYRADTQFKYVVTEGNPLFIEAMVLPVVL